jgi:hypothetical protein
MRRLWYIPIFGVILAIFHFRGSSDTKRPITAPASVGDWKLAAPATCKAPVPHEMLISRGTEGARSACSAEYVGTPAMKLMLYYMPNEFAGAFDAAQKYEQRAGRMGFFKGSYFGVVESPEADRATLDRFVVAIEAGLPPGSEFHH